MNNLVPINRKEIVLLEKYEKEFLYNKNPKTIDAYTRVVRQFLEWLQGKPGHLSGFRPEQFTRTSVETYLSSLKDRGQSVAHRNRVKVALSSFAKFLIDKELMTRNPTHGVEIPAQQILAPRGLTEDQRYILKNLVERWSKLKEEQPRNKVMSLRNEAIFALGYWAGCRASDVVWLKVEDCQIGPKIGQIKVGYKNEKMREIDLVNAARKPLFEYLNCGERKGSPYVFESQRGDRLSEYGLHSWFRDLKSLATEEEAQVLKAGGEDITFHTLRHDFAHRIRENGWTIEEVAYYLGHVTKKGTPAIATTARYLQVNREHVKEKVRNIRG